jgi:hypothetical protein
MRNISAILCFLLTPLSAHAQIEFFNTEAFWQKLVQDPASTEVRLSPGDTAIVVASNRIPDTANLRFMSMLRDGKQVRYFFVYTSGGKWHVKKTRDLYAAIRLMPDRNRDWVVYTEGMGKVFPTDLDRGFNMTGLYDVNVIMLDYPSITKAKRISNYFFANKMAHLCYQDFVPVLDTIRKINLHGDLGKGRLTLFFHSMGNIMMRQIVKKGMLPGINKEVWVNNIILNAPCVPRRNHKKWVDKIAFAERIYIHYNPKDYTLGGAYLLSKKIPLGKNLKRPISGKAVYINFHPIAGMGHSNFLSIKGREPIKKSCFDHYYPLLHGDEVLMGDPTYYRKSSYRGIGYDLVP